MTPTPPQLLYRSSPAELPRWRVELIDARDDATALVSFRSYGRNSCLLSQVAHWLAPGWSGSRWNPLTSKRVPADVLAAVEQQLQALPTTN